MQKALADELVQRILISLSVPAHEAVAEKRPRQQQRPGRLLGAEYEGTEPLGPFATLA